MAKRYNQGGTENVTETARNVRKRTAAKASSKGKRQQTVKKSVVGDAH